MSRPKIRVELSVENPIDRNYFYATLDLPATEQQINDAWQRARLWDSDDLYHDVTILNVPDLPGLEDMRLDTTSVEELNFLARRLDELRDEELVVYQALFQKRFMDQEESELVSVKDLINMTYGLDSVMIASNIRSDEELGQFVIENGLHPDVEAIPDESLYLLDKRRVGELQRQNDGGVFIGGFYVVTGDYEIPEVYDGEHLPAEAESAVLRLKIGPANLDDPVSADARAMWISLPIDRWKVNMIVRQEFEVPAVEDCSCFDIESSIPQISAGMFKDMDDFHALNTIAERYLSMTESEQIRFKAILEAENIQNIDDAFNATSRLDEYELTYFVQDEDSFFKDYLSHHLPTKFDSRWLDKIATAAEGNQILEKLGAKQTEYGILSARGGSLYELVPYGEPKAAELKTQAMTDEKLEVVEVLGQTALFTNGRVTQKELPEGLYKYDLREGESISFAAIEPSVAVNHAGTIITKEPIIFGEEGFLEFDEDSAPNFLGDEMTIEEFQNADLTQDEDESQQMGGMQL